MWASNSNVSVRLMTDMNLRFPTLPRYTMLFDDVIKFQVV
jgi:hypothetical protein